MAIEIKELIIKMTVNKNFNNFSDKKERTLSSAEKKELINECTEKILEKINLKIIR
jgi:hypothetical protein